MRSLMQNKKRLFIYGVSLGGSRKKVSKKLFAKNYHAVLYLIISQFCMLKKSQLKIEKQAQKVKKLLSSQRKLPFFWHWHYGSESFVLHVVAERNHKKSCESSKFAKCTSASQKLGKAYQCFGTKIGLVSHNSFTTNTYPWYYYCNMVTPKVFFLQIRNCPLPLSLFLYVMVYHSHHLSLYLMIIWSNEIVAVEKTLKLHSIKDRL